MHAFRKFLLCLLAGLFSFHLQAQDHLLGVFEQQKDIGKVDRKGYASYHPKTQNYFVGGGGINMWGTADAFSFVWKKLKGDFMITGEVELIGTGGDPHKKAGFMVRQDLEPDAAYADAIIHADGLTSLQYRQSQGEETYEAKNQEFSHGTTLRLIREGNKFTMFASRPGEPLQEIGSQEINLKNEVYLGLAVCAHQAGGFETAIFKNVRIDVPEKTEGKPDLISRLEILNIHTGNRRIVYETKAHFEAPNWSPDGSYLVFNQEGNLYKLPLKSSEPIIIETGFADRLNNDHGFSPDGSQFAVSHNTREQGSIIYLVPAEGGTPKKVTEEGPSYWHGWSPDGKMLAYCARRNDEYDIYTIPVSGGREKQLTDAKGLDDGPDYSPDGKFIYFNSVRTGTMQIWRMNADGSEETQLTFDAFHDWFPHPSPDNKWLIFVSYLPEVEGHPANKRVMLRKMPVNGGKPEVVAYLYGGQGTINVPSWSPDGSEVAFVSYSFTE